MPSAKNDIDRLQRLVDVLALVVLGICIYTFLLGNKVFEGKFANEEIPWYFLAKGIFCSVAMMLLVRVVVHLKAHK